MATTTQCVNHPGRAAIERCEVCNEPLCAYCLYYTNDGQRLCKTHADEAQEAGAFIRAPGAYAGALIGAQVDASQAKPEKTAAYSGDAVDILAFIGLMFGIVSLMCCFPPALCLIGPIGLVTSVVALVTAKDAHDPGRTRTLAGVGITLSSLLVVVLLLCIVAYFTQATIFTSVLRGSGLSLSQPTQPISPPSAVPTVLPTARP